MTPTGPQGRRGGRFVRVESPAYDVMDATLMETINNTNLCINVTESIDLQGRPWLVVTMKSSHAIPPDHETPPQAIRPRGLHFRDVFEGIDGLSSPLIEADLVPQKLACDVIVKGSAHVPHGTPVAHLTAGIKVGPIEKVVQVTGDRRWIRRGGKYELGRPEPFVSMPITYSRAFGGMYDHHAIGSEDPKDFLAHPANLVGCGYARGKFLELLEHSRGPNIERPDDRVVDPRRLYEPISLGPIARNWAPRLALAGTYDQRWRDEVFPLLPRDFNVRYFQCAPADQQMPFPRGGEEVRLTNLLPGGGTRRFLLPRLELPMVALMKSRRKQVLQPVVDTIVVDTDDGVIDLVWRARASLDRSLSDVHTVAVGNVCKRWWESVVYGTADCGCAGIEADAEDLIPVTEVASGSAA